MTAPAGVGTRALQTWSDDVAAAARRNGVRIVGAGALGVICPDIAPERDVLRTGRAAGASRPDRAVGRGRNRDARFRGAAADSGSRA